MIFCSPESGVFGTLLSLLVFSSSPPSIDDVKEEFSVSLFRSSSIFSTNYLWAKTLSNKLSSFWISSVKSIELVLWMPTFDVSSSSFSDWRSYFIFLNSFIISLYFGEYKSRSLLSRSDLKLGCLVAASSPSLRAFCDLTYNEFSSSIFDSTIDSVTSS